VIRLRVIDCESTKEYILSNGATLVWYTEDKRILPVVLEQTETMGPYGDAIDPEWEPVEIYKG